MSRPAIAILTVVLSLSLAATFATAQQYDTSMAWPLCGRIDEAPPAGWVETDGCPAERWGNAGFTDEPIASPYGPRPLASENGRYDFHRGIDIATDSMTPVFAIADGVVRIAGSHPSYSDPLVQLRHFRPGEVGCGTVGCYHSNYMHLTQAVVVVDVSVSKGDLIGYSGASASGFEHLHFEIRDAPGFDPFSSWQRDCVHPVGVLPYSSATVPDIIFETVDTSDPANPQVRLKVLADRIDIVRVDLELFDSGGGSIPQAGNTPNANGYNEEPSWFGMNAWNAQYTHKDSSSIPWESFGPGGTYECPYNSEHGGSYSAHVHMDRQLASDPKVGDFNGAEIRPVAYSEGNYTLDVTFKQLVGPAACIVATVQHASGGTSTAEWGTCSPSGGFNDFTATSELLSGGTQQGDYTDTSDQNEGAVEVLTERQSGGKPRNRYSFLDHEWTVDIGAGGGTATLWIDAYTSQSTDGDTFELSATGASGVVTLDRTSDTDGYQTLTLPAGASGLITVGLSDTDQTPGAKALDSVTVDHLFIRVEDPGELMLPNAPTNANANALSASNVELTWDHSGDDESGFKVERQTQNPDLSWGSWQQVGTAAVDAVSFTDSSLSSQQTLRYRVAATNAASDSDWADSNEVTTPLGLSAAASGHKSKGWQYVNVSWSGAPLGNVDIWRSDNGGSAQLIATVPAGVSGSGSHEDGPIAKGSATYDYQVCVEGDAGICSNVASVVF